MRTIAEKVMTKLYRDADGHAERLPWHRETPSHLLSAAVAELGGRGRALDAGCGAGVLSVWLAERGLEVTGIDLLPEAIAMARSVTRQRDVTIELVQTDLLTYSPERPFELVYDSGCLHSLVGGDTHAYRRQLLRCLALSGIYVLEHWGKRHAFDWRPIGPRRRTPATIARVFAPELALVDSEVIDFKTPLPFGPTVRGIGYRFRRAA
jgi:SAM-dependent methyltransferase